MSSKQKVFCLGAHKTGTTSLTRAFEALGYQALPEDIANKYVYKPLEELFGVIDAGEYDFFEDSPFNHHDNYRAIHQKYPHSRYILTYRQPDSWFDSVLRWNQARGYPKYWEELYGHRICADNKSAIVADYLSRIGAIEELFKNSEDFLKIDICGGEGWEKLSRFLGCGDVPSGDFFHENINTKILQS